MTNGILGVVLVIVGLFFVGRHGIAIPWALDSIQESTAAHIGLAVFGLALFGLGAYLIYRAAAG